jgi:hypothetical protein
MEELIKQLLLQNSAQMGLAQRVMDADQAEYKALRDQLDHRRQGAQTASVPPADVAQSADALGAALVRSGNPMQQAFGRGFNQSLYSPAPVPQPMQPMPNPDAYLGDVVGMTESGQPVYNDARAQPQFDRRGRQVVALPGGVVGTNERGDALDVRGRPVDLAADDLPARRGLRPADRREQDVTMADRDPFGRDVLERDYGEHLRAMEDNRDERGLPTDKFPAGHLNGFTKEKRKEIIEGVKALKEIQRGIRT